MSYISNILKNSYVLFIGGLLLGALLLLSIRFAAYEPEHTHYHANFAVFINGERETFNKPQFYEAVNICSTDGGITIPQQRAHMHGNINSVVHVHDDHAVTWGDFFTNLGWTVTGDLIKTDEGKLYVADDANKVNLIINGEDFTDIEAISNRLIEDEDRLLVSYGPTDQTALTTQAKAVPSTAEEYNGGTDPGNCSSHEATTVKQRLQNLF